MVQAFYGRNAGHPRWGRGAKDWRATWIGGGPYNGLKTAAASLACAQPTRPCVTGMVRGISPAQAWVEHVRRQAKGEGEWHMANWGSGRIRLTNNGVVMQNFNSDDMAHKIPRCIEWITSIHTLHPGDILATGTNHRGLNPFMDGDNIELTCEGCGTLHIAVRDDLKRTWARITRLQHKQSGAEGAHTKQTGGKYAPSK